MRREISSLGFVRGLQSPDSKQIIFRGVETSVRPLSRN